MGSSTNPPPPALSPPAAPSAADAPFLAAFQTTARAAGTPDQLRFDAFMRLALYDATVGYYRAARARVGRGAGTDFYTATSSGPIFGELIAAAAGHLLGNAALAATHTFVEIGAESAGGVLRDVAHPFATARTVALGQAPALAGPCIVFSNELFDAQPFRRFRRSAHGWTESHVQLTTNPAAPLRESFLPLPLATPTPFPPLPADVPPGYTLDWPAAATTLAAELAAAPWHGLFIACDYGKSWAELATGTPAGTGRAYHRHTQVPDLLARPGRQDLTCHICWDALAAALTAAGCTVAPLASQEAFFVRHAADFLARTLAETGPHFDRRKLSILQLLHPSNLGQKFQVLHAHRRSATGGAGSKSG